MGERRDPTGSSPHVASIRSSRTNAERDDPAVPFRSDNSSCSTGRAGDLLPRRDEEGRSHRSLCAGPAGTDALRRTVGRRGRPARSPGLPTAVGTLQRGVRHPTQGPVGHARTRRVTGVRWARVVLRRGALRSCYNKNPALSDVKAGWRAREDSNPRHSAPKADALSRLSYRPVWKSYPIHAASSLDP